MRLRYFLPLLLVLGCGMFGLGELVRDAARPGEALADIGGGRAGPRGPTGPTGPAWTTCAELASSITNEVGTCGTLGGPLLSNSPTVTGTLGVSGSLGVTGQAYVNIPTAGTTAGTGYTVNWATGNGQVFDAQGSSGNVTFTFSNPQAGASYVLKLIQGSSARTYTWPAAVKWPAGIAPVVTTTNDAVDLVSCFYDEASTYRCSFTLDVK